ncbi:MAG: gamma-glutamylcyclotransferase family protein [Verrucomicrobium sp.]
MFHYFGYGSNIDLTSLRAKGVAPLSSEYAVLTGWRLAFSVRHFFRHEGGVANIIPSEDPTDEVHGMVHLCEDEALLKLDAAEAYGYGYDRIEVEIEAQAHRSRCKAVAYVGMPPFLDDSCLPSRRYLNILCNGAQKAGLNAEYLDRLRRHPIHPKQVYPPFIIPYAPDVHYTRDTLPSHCTALAGAVFDMSGARPEHAYLKQFFGGRDMTLFHLKRMDTSDGSETLEDVIFDRLNLAQHLYLAEYLHEYCAEYSFVGRYDYEP